MRTRWLVVMREPNTNMRIAGMKRTDTKQQAIDVAKEFCSSVGRSAVIEMYGARPPSMRYWRDDTGLHYLEL